MYKDPNLSSGQTVDTQKYLCELVSTHQTRNVALNLKGNTSEK